MKKAMLMTLALLSACAAPPSKYSRGNPPSGENVAKECKALPVTRKMWGDAYLQMLDYKTDPDWFYPAYVGLGTLSWIIAAPMIPAAEFMVTPMWAGQECTWENTLKEVQEFPQKVEEAAQKLRTGLPP